MLGLLSAAVGAVSPQASERHFIYAAVPDSDADADRSIRILVFDIANGHRLVRRIPLWPAARADEAETVRGIAAHPPSGRVYISTTKRLAAIDLGTDRVVWEKNYDGHCCERMAISPDGETIYAPAFGSPRWFVVQAATGELRASIGVTGWPRATIYSRDGRYVFLGAWDSPVLSVADTARHAVVRTVGPFGGSVCPFAVNGKNTLAFANVDGLVGFEWMAMTRRPRRRTNAPATASRSVPANASSGWRTVSGIDSTCSMPRFTRRRRSQRSSCPRSPGRLHSASTADMPIHQPVKCSIPP